MKNYVGITRDHSASMRGMESAAMRDFNQNIEAIRSGSKVGDIDTVVSVVLCGVGRGAFVVDETTISSVNALKPLNRYVADGHGTPLYDSIGKLIEDFERLPDASNPEVSFIVMVITDGRENRSTRWTASRLNAKIRELQGTDRWTFVFRVPVGYKHDLTFRLGLHDGNVQEWDTTAAGLEQVSAVTASAVGSYYKDLASGKKSTSRFFANLNEIKPSEIKAVLEDISDQIVIFKTAQDAQIRDLVEEKIGTYQKGTAFYELKKTEKVQAYKEIVIKHRKSGKSYSGDAARQVLGLPVGSEIKLAPGQTGQYDVFIQSTSVNRKIPANGRVMVWEGAKV